MRNKSKRACYGSLLLMALIIDTIPVNNAPRTLSNTPSTLKTYNTNLITPFIKEVVYNTKKNEEWMSQSRPLFFKYFISHRESSSRF